MQSQTTALPITEVFRFAVVYNRIDDMKKGKNASIGANIDLIKQIRYPH